MHLLKVFLFIGLSYVATKGQNGPAPKGDACVRRITTQVSRYFWKLQSRRIDYRERNNRIFADIPFPQLTIVYGWTMTGKTGRISQAREDGRGIITEYMVQFLGSDGNWTFINNSKTGKEMFTNLGNIAIPDTATSVTLSNPVKTLVLRVIPELWDGVPFMRLSIQHCADTVMAEQRPILPIQIQHSSVKKNLEDQIKNRLKSKISKVMKKVKQMEQRIGHHKGHGVKDRKKAGKHKSSSERNRVNHRKNKSRRKHITQQNTRQKKPIIKTQHQKRSEVEKKSLDTYDIDGRFGRGDYFGDFGYKYRRGQRDALKRKNSKQSKGQVSHKGGTQARGRKPTNSKPVVQGQHSSKGKTPARKPYTPDITPSKNVKTKTESIAPAKTASSQKLVEMQRLEKENTALSESVYGSCRLRPVWRYNKAIFRPADTFSTLRDVRQAWRAMYGLGIQPYLFRIPERFQKFRNQKYYLEIEFRKITNVFGLKVAGSSSQLQWGAVTRFSLYHKRKDSEPWQGYVDRLNQPRVFDVGTREKGNAHAPSVFRLDVPVTAKAIRIYPEKWASAPIMMGSERSASRTGRRQYHKTPEDQNQPQNPDTEVVDTSQPRHLGLRLDLWSKSANLQQFIM
uniref:F5/8 type C domain-containing protein n=1 Tax=Magallana gigas TaxID=29159 RepID=A0A8W8IFG2_MAGGI